jgi:hypothetical protein
MNLTETLPEELRDAEYQAARHRALAKLAAVVATTSATMADAHEEQAAALKQFSNAVRPTKRKSRSSSDSANVPADLAPLSTPNRVLHVMAPEPQRRWERNELAAATHTATASRLATALSRLTQDGKISRGKDNRYQLLPET